MVKNEVGITSEKKLRGFREYLVCEHHPLNPDGTRRDLYHYLVPRELVKKALDSGAWHRNAGVAGEKDKAGDERIVADTTRNSSREGAT